MTRVGDFHLLNNTLLVAVLLFAIGAAGAMARRSRASLTISFGVMILAGMTAVIGIGSFYADFAGRSLWTFFFAISLMAVAVVLVIVVSAQRGDSVADDAERTQPTVGDSAGGPDA